MKKILGLMAMILVIGCSLYSMDESRDEYYGELAKGHEIYFGTDEQYSEWMSLSNMSEVSLWIRNNIEYKEDDREEFSDPEVTLKRGYGDCDDFALLAMNIIYIREGIKMDLILLDSYIQDSERVIVEGGSVNHATIGFNGIVYFLYQLEYAWDKPIVGFAYSFDYVFPNAPAYFETSDFKA